MTARDAPTLSLRFKASLRRILGVDDNSPDETAGVVGKIMAQSLKEYFIEYMRRGGKLGLGTAYIEGFKWALDREYYYLIEGMDADRSHDPDALPAFIGKMEKGYDLVIGSRYLDGRINVVGWDFRRLLLSKFGNLYASVLLGLKLTDLTSGFRCYSKIALESVNLDNIWSNGYAFQIEMAYLISIAGLSVGEIPIIFHERTAGTSKMSKRIVLEAMLFPWRARFLQILERAPRDNHGSV